MSERLPTAELADRLALAIVEHGASSGSQLAGIVGARKATVLRELRSAPRFERVGRGPSSVWRLAGTGWEPIHGDESLDRDHGADPDDRERLAALERRVAELERLLPPLAAVEVAAPLAGQLTVDDALAMNGAEAAT